MKITLTSRCNVKDCKGIPGDIVDVKDKELAQRIIDGRGGFECDANGEPVKAKEDAKEGK